jgi:O-antigen ligase
MTLNSIQRTYGGQVVTVVCVTFIALLIGAFLPIYTDLVGGQIGKLATLPAFLILGILLLYDRKLMLVIIILTRAAGDIFFNASHFTLGGLGIGIGGLINAFVILISLILVLEDPKLFPRRYALTWIVFLAITLYGSVVTPVRSDAVRSWLALVSYFAIFISAFSFVKTADDFKFCVRLVLWSSVLPVLYSFIDIALNAPHLGAEGFRLKSTFGHANIFAFYLLLIISFIFYQLKNTPLKGNVAIKFFLVGYIFLLLGLLILTKTRSAWVACAVTFMLYALFFERRYFIYISLAMIATLFIPGVGDRIADLSQGNEVVTYSKLNSYAWRVYVWQSAFAWTKPQDYFIGHGMQSFREYAKIFFPMSGGNFVGAHNVYVQYLFEIGVAGTAAYLAIYYKILVDLFEMLKFNRLGGFFVITTIVSYLICSFSDNMLDYLSFNWYLWFVIGAGCASVGNLKNKKFE